MSDYDLNFPTENRRIKTSQIAADFFARGDDVRIFQDPYAPEKAEIVVKGRTRIKNCQFFRAAGRIPIVVGIYKGEDGGERSVTIFFLREESKNGVIIGVVQRLDEIGRGEGLWESEDQDIEA